MVLLKPIFLHTLTHPDMLCEMGNSSFTFEAKGACINEVPSPQFHKINSMILQINKFMETYDSLLFLSVSDFDSTETWPTPVPNLMCFPMGSESSASDSMWNKTYPDWVINFPIQVSKEETECFPSFRALGKYWGSSEAKWVHMRQFETLRTIL